ncbi:MAG: threonine/homoserine/homoserine lactone efflux protein [Moritella sp.]|jgi:threonine/homoserine/homoserine lactone efflux protein
MLGIVFGFSLMIILVGFGLIGLFTTYPIIHQFLQIGCMLYLIYLAVMIATSKPITNNIAHYRPMSFLAAASFQWVNPKGWSMALTAISVYASPTEQQGILLVSLIFGLINIPSVSIWAIAGKQLQTTLKNPKKIRFFNYCMAGLLLSSIVQIV